MTTPPANSNSQIHEQTQLERRSLSIGATAAMLGALGVGAAMGAIDALQGASDDRVQQKRLALERARYEVTHARRQYDAVDPANRLVAAELERRWNQALTTEAQLEAELTSLQQSPE